MQTESWIDICLVAEYLGGNGWDFSEEEQKPFHWFVAPAYEANNDVVLPFATSRMALYEQSKVVFAHCLIFEGT